MLRLLYTALFSGAVPLIVLRLYWRGRRNPDYRRRIGERFGFYGDRLARRDVIWIHAVSVGETESAAPLVRRLREQYPDTQLLVTTTTPTGSARVQALFGDSVAHCYLPYDLPGPVDRFLVRFRPRLGVILETEIWPNLFTACEARSLPLVIVNARLSRRSAAGYARVPGLVSRSLGAVRAIASQTSDDAERFAALGADKDRIAVTGNIKFDLEIGDDVIRQGRQYRETLFGPRPVVLAASTHAGEEEQLLARFHGLRERLPGLLMVMVPRHPERFAPVAALCRAAGFRTVLRSETVACSADDDVFVLDSMGELRTFYAAADVAFVGGSLVPVGGHNVLEPAVLGLPVVFGPHVENFRAICDALLGAGGAVAAEDASAVAESLARLLGDAQLRSRMGERARACVLQNRGSLGRVCAMLARYVAAADSDTPEPRSSGAASSPKGAG